jgi:hypothetical protein
MKQILIASLLIILTSCGQNCIYISDEDKFQRLPGPLILVQKDIVTQGINAHSIVMVRDSSGVIHTFSNCAISHVLGHFNPGDTIQ